MKQKRKLISLILCLVMLVTVMGGCSKKNNTNDSEATTNTEKTDVTESMESKEEAVEISYDEHVEYSFWIPATPNSSQYYADYSDNPIIDYIEKKFNVTLNFEQPATGTEGDALSLMFGTGDYPDVIDLTSYQGSVSKLNEEGVVIDLTDMAGMYMPNYMALMESSENIKKNLYSDDHKILKLTQLSNALPLTWGGFLYRRDILETMTGNNVVFPSGNDNPITIEDWDYMLPLLKQYFDASGMPDTAPLIIPYNGYFPTGELTSGFGTAGTYFVDQASSKVVFGPSDDKFYNYLKKMNEWYKAGYIYQDFASRTTDLFYLPNTALTYGAAAGIWYGFNSQLGKAMSLPDYNLFVDVKGIASPIDTANGITSANMRVTVDTVSYGGFVVTDKCKNVERLLSIIDFLYSDEASYLSSFGLDAEHGAADNSYYKEWGLQEGAYKKLEDGTIDLDPRLKTGGELAKLQEAYVSIRTPGLLNVTSNKANNPEELVEADKQWALYENSMSLPIQYTRTVEEDDVYVANQSNIDDYINTQVPQFIMGITELNEENWQKFKAQLEEFGVVDNTKIMQDAVDRFNAR